MGLANLIFKDRVGCFTLICFIAEVVSFALVLSQHYSICVQAREISIYYQIFVLLIYPYIFPDMFMLILNCITDNVAIRPFGVVYEFCAALFILGASIQLFSGLTFCGNSAQIYLFCAALCALVASILHVVMLFDIRARLPRNVVFGRTDSSL